MGAYAPADEEVKVHRISITATITRMERDLPMNIKKLLIERERIAYIRGETEQANFLANVLDIVNAQMASQINLLNSTTSGLLPDYVATTGVIAEVDDASVTLSRDDGSNRQYITTPKNQNSTIYQTQGSIEVKNRVNTGGTTVITIIQK